MIHGGVEPDLLDDTGHWRMDDLWVFALQALYAFAAASASRAGLSVGELCSQIAARRSHP